MLLLQRKGCLSNSKGPWLKARMSSRNLFIFVKKLFTKQKCSFYFANILKASKLVKKPLNNKPDLFHPTFHFSLKFGFWFCSSNWPFSSSGGTRWSDGRRNFRRLRCSSRNRSFQNNFQTKFLSLGRLRGCCNLNFYYFIKIFFMLR